MSTSAVRPDWLSAPMQITDLELAARREASWLWQGYLAHGSVTLLTSQWKAGKTTLLSVLLDRMKAGGQLAGLPVAPGQAVIVTEESPDLWFERSRRLNYAGHVHWFCRPFRGRPTREQWLELVDHVHTLHQQLNLSLFVIDPLAAFLPGRDENNANVILEAVTPLQQLTAAGLAVLLLHHPRKHPSPDGQAARGSGALQGFADILIEMHWFSRAAETDRRRVLLAWSRFRDTPRQTVIELNEAGTDYAALGTRDDIGCAVLNVAVQGILGCARDKLTLKDIQDAWPLDVAAPGQSQLWRWLTGAVENRQLLYDGSGVKGDPFRYWLAEREAIWRKNPLRALELDDAAHHRKLMEKLDEEW